MAWQEYVGNGQFRTPDPKPPLGVTPDNIYWEMCYRTRVADIADAIVRYVEAGKPVPVEWAKELRRLSEEMRPR